MFKSSSRQISQLSRVSIKNNTIKTVATKSGFSLTSKNVTSRNISFISYNNSVLNVRSGLKLQNANSPLLLSRNYAVKTVKVPEMAESITEGSIGQWLKKPGDYVEQDEEVCSIETDKIDVAVNAPVAGTIKEELFAEGDTVTVGQDLLTIEEGVGKASSEKKPESESKPAEPKESAPAKEESKPASPPPSSAPTKAAPAPSPSKPAETSAPKPSKPASKSSSPSIQIGAAGKSFSRAEHREKMTRIRLRTAQRLKESQNSAASLTTFNEVDLTSIIELRKLYKDEILKATGIKLGFMSLFTKAATLAMRNIPSVNAAIENNDTIVYRDYVDISVAVATPKGLVTPVVRNVESLSVLEIEKAIHDIGEKARDGKLTLEDLAGGTFTISNGGVFGSLYGTPIINLPQTAVLGMHGIKQRAVVVNGKVEARPMMYLALTYDHRVLDGREAVTYLRLICEYLSDPRKMLLA